MTAYRLVKEDEVPHAFVVRIIRSDDGTMKAVVLAPAQAHLTLVEGNNVSVPDFGKPLPVSEALNRVWALVGVTPIRDVVVQLGNGATWSGEWGALAA